MSTASPHEILQTNYLNFDAYTVTKHDPYQRDRILMLDVCFSSKSPKVALNFLRNASKLLNISD
jgi:hypothetical protein